MKHLNKFKKFNESLSMYRLLHSGKMNLTAEDFKKLDISNISIEELSEAFSNAYLRGNRDSQNSLKTLLNEPIFKDMKIKYQKSESDNEELIPVIEWCDMVDNQFAKKGSISSNRMEQSDNRSYSPSIARFGSSLF